MSNNNLCVNTFDISDYIINLHKKNNISLSLCKLQTIIFCYQIVSKITHVIPSVDDNFILENNFIFLKDIERKYRKEKDKDIAKINKHNTPAKFTPFGSACLLLTQLTLFFNNFNDKQLKALVRKTPAYKKNVELKQKIITIEKKHFKEYYPLKKWADAFNMFVELDGRFPQLKI